MFEGLSSKEAYFNQVLSLSPTPVQNFTSTNWSSLVDLLMSLLTNPFFYCIIGVLLIMTILPKFED